MIVKVQAAQGGELGKVLVYNKDQSVFWEEGPSVAARKIMFLMSGKPKVFMHATLSEEGVISLDSLAPDQDW